jgi:hypothetical protein
LLQTISLFSEGIMIGMLKQVSPVMVEEIISLNNITAGRWVTRTCKMQTAWALHDRHIAEWQEPDDMRLTEAGRMMARYLQAAQDRPDYRLQSLLNANTKGCRSR